MQCEAAETPVSLRASESAPVFPVNNPVGRVEHVDAAHLMRPVPTRFPDSAAVLSKSKPFRIVIITIGTRGDVQPYVALGQVRSSR
jgi:hypothetical protein